MRRIGLPLLVVMVAAAAVSGCGLSRGQVACSMAAPPANPVEVPRSWSYGAAVVVGVVGPPEGRTKTFSPGYQTDRYALEVERVVAVVPASPHAEPALAPVTEADVAAISEIGNVHYPDQPPSCGGKMQNASIHEGDRMLLILGPPQPTADLWTVGPAMSVIDLAGERGDETAAWQPRATTGSCEGHLTYDLAALEAAFDDPAVAPHLTPTCTPA
jgi:hypothetical protein